jgi:primosomal protein N' (replication factor Y) (superfamily II helicase)
MAEAVAKLEGIAIQGPVAALIPRVRNQYVQELLLKCPKDLKVLQMVKTFLKEQRAAITHQKAMSDVQVVIDVDPA